MNNPYSQREERDTCIVLYSDASKLQEGAYRREPNSYEN